MGTDVYLSWDGMTQKQKQKRITGLDIGSGKVGYLRASIGMYPENTVLRHVFPDHWNGEERAFDFMSEENTRLVVEMTWRYTMSTLTGEEQFLPTNTHVQAHAEMCSKLLEPLIGGLAKDGGKVVMTGREPADIYSTLAWALSLMDFYRLGYEKQKAGKNPKVYISW
jgi:hypothetical protein